MWLSTFLFALCVITTQASFTNPTFQSQDPWVTYVNGMYYYSESYCSEGTICIKASKTLTGLAAAPWTGVWSAPSGQSNSGDVWAPEIHYVSGKWYIYYAADDGNNNNHRLFVLESDDPLGKFVEGNTGHPNGQLVDSTNNWAIDPDVFVYNDKIYITWSCTNQANADMPQRICLAELCDPLHICGDTTFLSTPSAYWETRTAPINEGPVGYVQQGRAYITYSASASWVADDYAVGLLSLAPGSDPLDASSWTKSGPIFDHHSKAYGAGSVVFTPSVDGSEYWVMYHAIDSLSCQPAYSCRDIRMQQMYFDPVGYPVLGYPVDPGVALKDPAGEGGSPKGTSQIAAWGDSWGDAAEGNPSAGTIAGNWNYTDRWTAQSGLGGAWDQTFSPWNPNPANYTAHVEVQLVKTGNTQGFPKYGFYCAYDDANNHVELFIDPIYMVLASHGVQGGVQMPWQNANLPADFDPREWHSLDCIKSGTSFRFSLDGGAVSYSREFNVENGQTGLVVVDTIANYRNLQLYPECCN